MNKEMGRQTGIKTKREENEGQKTANEEWNRR